MASVLLSVWRKYSNGGDWFAFGRREFRCSLG